MERIILVHPPISRYDEAEIAPPLALVHVALAAEELGHECEILDLNLPEYRWRADTVNFYEYATDLVLQRGPTAVGITSMGVNTHVSIELANRLAPDVVGGVVIGGVHATSIAEALHPFLRPNARIVGQRSPLSPSWSTRECQMALPQIAHRMTRLESREIYWSANARRVVNFEGGRGCKYKCAFCYSPPTHSTWHTAHVDGLCEAFDVIADAGFRHVFLVEDNLTNDPRWLVDFTRKLSQRPRLTWNGYATIPDLTPSLVDACAEAGCVNLYLGIDAVDPTQQRAWNKSFLKDSARLFELLSAAEKASMELTCAFIIDASPEADHQTRATLALAREVSLRGGDVRLALLTPYPRTRLAATEHPVVPCSMRTAILMDVPYIVTENPLAARLGHAFPWHVRPAGIDAWHQRLLALLAAQVLVRDWSSNVDCAAIWDYCLLLAADLERVEEIHKTELKAAVRAAHHRRLVA